MQKIYFASDFHLGLDARTTSKEREQLLVSWLDEVSKDASHLYLVGDLFDFWFEYKYTIPKGFVRFLGKLASLKDKGIIIEAFTGNHDMWMFSYLQEELGIPIHRSPIVIEFFGKKVLIGHGDGLGPGDHGYKFLKKVFASPICQWLFARLHPNFSFGMAKYWSGKSRLTNAAPDHFLGEENEWLIQFCKDHLAIEHIDIFIFGHRHFPIDFYFNELKSRYINLGDWLLYNTYAVMDENKLTLESYEGNKKIYTNKL